MCETRVITAAATVITTVATVTLIVSIVSGAIVVIVGGRVCSWLCFLGDWHGV